MAGYWTVADGRLATRQAEEGGRDGGGLCGAGMYLLSEAHAGRRPASGGGGGAGPRWLGIMCNLISARENKGEGTSDRGVGGRRRGGLGQLTPKHPPPHP